MVTKQLCAGEWYPVYSLKEDEEFLMGHIKEVQVTEEFFAEYNEVCKKFEELQKALLKMAGRDAV